MAKTQDLENFDVSMASVLRVYAYFFRFARPYLPHLILISALMLIQVPVEQLSLFLVRDVTDQALLATDRTTAERLGILLQIMLIQAGLWLAGDLLWKWRELLNWYLFMRGTFDLRLAFFKHLHSLPLRFLRLRPPGEHLYRATSDIMTNHNDPFDLGLMGMVAWTVLPIVETIYTLGWAGFFLYQVDPWLAWAVAFYLIPYGYAAHVSTGWLRHVSTEVAYGNAAETALMRDSIGGLRAAKSMGKALHQRHRFTEIVNRLTKLRIKNAAIAITGGEVVQWLVRWGFTSALYLYLAYRVIQGETTIGSWLATFAIVESARVPVERLVGAIQSIRIWTVNGQRVLQTMTVEPDLPDQRGATPMPTVQGAIRFEGVSLDYDEGRRALDRIDLEITPGESVGFVGPSGAGKSSLLNLLLRLYAPTEGRILVDGADLRSVRIADFRGHCAVVPQSTFLYDGTLRENLLFGNPHADDEAMEQALLEAGAGSLLERGLDYPVGDASTLSGGERQRVGIARALLRDPSVLILDEATANLDPETEAHVLTTLESLFPGRTTLVVAHRLKAVRRCDRIVVMREGRIAAVGTHATLLDQDPWYRQVWEDQRG
jgi:ABC-type multidrug transport system fused ATPase/permease subunit